MKKILFLIAIILSTTLVRSQTKKDISPKEYQKLLGKGIDVDWCKTAKGIRYYNKKTVVDFKKRGFSHVRIRIKNNANEKLLGHLDSIINDCLNEGLIPIIAYQADTFKKNPNQENLNKVIAWWQKISDRYKNYSNLLSFDIIIEVTNKLNKNPKILNDLYEKVVAKIREKNPHRIIFISPIVRSSPEHLKDLKIPSKANGFLMAEWHFYAAGPSKTNPKKLWTTGTEKEKKIIKNKIITAYNWQKKNKIYTWVGAWMPGNYNKGNNYSIEEQVKFANFVTCELDKYHLPFAINSDTKFYDREKNQWLKQKEPVLNAILKPKCNNIKL
jgi:hypothetical protein